MALPVRRLSAVALPPRTPTASGPARRGRFGLLRLLAKHQGLEPLETQLRFPQRKEQPKVEGQNLHQDAADPRRSRHCARSAQSALPLLHGSGCTSSGCFMARSSPDCHKVITGSVLLLLPERGIAEAGRDREDPPATKTTQHSPPDESLEERSKTKVNLAHRKDTADGPYAPAVHQPSGPTVVAAACA